MNNLLYFKARGIGILFNRLLLNEALKEKQLMMFINAGEGRMLYSFLTWTSSCSSERYALQTILFT